MGTGGHFLAKTAVAVALIGTTCLLSQSLTARRNAPQLPSALPPPDWQVAAGGKMAFDTASVTQNTTAPPAYRTFSFPLGPGDVYIPNGGRFSAKNIPLYLYIYFAYKITDNQEQVLLPQLPRWVTTDRFDIQAKAEGNPTKDQMRLMMQALLADRFRLAVHHEMRQ